MSCAPFARLCTYYYNIPYRVLEALVSHQKDCILDEDEDGNTPLHLASLNGYSKCVKLLLGSQADFDARYV